MNLSDLSIKAYSIGINLEVLDFLNIIKQLDNLGCEINCYEIDSPLSPGTLFYIAVKNSPEFADLINKLEKVCGLLKLKHSLFDSFNSELRGNQYFISFELLQSKSNSFYNDQSPILIDYIEKYKKTNKVTSVSQ